MGIDIFLRTAIVCHLSNDIGQFRIVGCDSTGITQCAKILTWIKAYSRSIAQVPCNSTLITCTMSLCHIIHYY